MQGIRFSGTFTFNAQDRQAATAAKLDSQDYLLKAKEEGALARDAEERPLLLSTIEAEDGDKFYIQTCPSGDDKALGKKNVDAMDEIFKDLCKSSNIPFKYSASHKGVLKKINRTLVKAANGPTADKIFGPIERLLGRNQERGSN